MTIITYLNHEILKNGTRILSFNYPIKKVLEINKIFIILLNVPLNVICNENVFALNYDGVIMWQLKRNIVPYVNPIAPITNIYLSTELILSRFDGWDIYVKPKSGELIGKQFTK